MEEGTGDTRKEGLEESQHAVRDCKAMAEDEALWSG